LVAPVTSRVDDALIAPFTRRVEYSVEAPVTASVPEALSALVALMVLNVAVVPVRLVIVEEAEVSSEVEAVVAERFVIVVVARVEVPRTVSLPEVVAFPLVSTVKSRFSAQLDPFQ
jgi:hypothetical protein